MNEKFFSSNTKIDKVMTEEQFNQIVEAILGGKYSWACVLILKFAGYNPLHYLPYRTYKRLMKDNLKNKQIDKITQKYPHQNKKQNHKFSSIK